MSLYEDSLDALAHLLRRVCATGEEAHIRSDLEAWRTRRDAAQHRRKYGGHSTYSDWVIHRLNGHQVDEIQQVWANSLLETLQLVLRRISEKLDDPRQERKILNALTRHRPLLKKPPSREAPGKQRGSGKYLRAIRCQQCGDRHASYLSVENVIAGDVIGDYFYDAYTSGTLIELVDTLLDGTVENLVETRKRVRSAAERAGIGVLETDRQHDACAACNGDDVTVKSWVLLANGELRFELAAHEQHESNTAATRIWGSAIATLAFFVLIAEFLYLDRAGVPAATGSLRGNWGTLILLGLPLVIIVAGTLQAMSGVVIRDYLSAFANETPSKKIAVSAIAVAVAVSAVTLAALISSIL